MDEWEPQNLPPELPPRNKPLPESMPPRKQPLQVTLPPEPPAVWPWVLGFGLAVSLLVVAPIVAIVFIASSSLKPVAVAPAPRVTPDEPVPPQLQPTPPVTPKIEIPQTKPPRPFPEPAHSQKPPFPAINPPNIAPPPHIPPPVVPPRIEPPVAPQLPTPNGTPTEEPDETAAPGRVLIYLALLKPDSSYNVKELKGFQNRLAFALDGKKLSHGIWAQPNTDKGTSRIVYTLDGKYEKLTGSAGLSDITARFPAGSRLTPSCRFAVWGDGQVLWESRKITGRGDKTAFHLDIEGVKKITLVAETYTYSYMSNCVWGNLMLEGPQPTSEK